MQRRFEHQPAGHGESSVPSLPELERSPSVPSVDELRRLTTEARLPGEPGRRSMAQLDGVLARVLPSERLASALLELFDAHAFDGLLDVSGKPIRAKAIAAFRSLGYPYALQLPAEELEWLALQRREAIWRAVAIAGRTVLGAGLLALVIWLALSFGP